MHNFNTTVLLKILFFFVLLSYSYLDLLGTFQKLVSSKKSEIVNARKRTKNGLDKVIHYFLSRSITSNVLQSIARHFSCYRLLKKLKNYKKNLNLCSRCSPRLPRILKKQWNRLRKTV